MSNILNEQLDLSLSSNFNDDVLTSLDPTRDYLEAVDANPLEFVDNSSTSNTTPEFNSPEDMLNYQHQYSNYNYQRPIFHSKSLSFSLPDKLNLLNLSSASSKSPSPEFIYKEVPDNRTINPKQLFSSPTYSKERSVNQSLPSQAIVTSNVTKPHFGTQLPNQPGAPTSRDYILPSSSSSPNLTTTLKESAVSRDVDFKMNNECFNAINVWINNNGIDDYQLIDPTGILKPVSRRRNSIQLGSSPVFSGGIDKRKRRKSTNSNANASEVRGSLFQHQLMHRDDTVEEEDDDTTAIQDSPKPQPQPQQQRQQSSTVATTKKGLMKHLLDKEIVSTTIRNSDNTFEEVFPCPDCAKVFKRSEHLKRHIRSVHSNIRPFHCKYCEKQFSRSDNLAQHLKTHYKQNPDGTTTIIYGNPNIHHRGGGRKKSTASSDAGSDGSGNDANKSRKPNRKSAKANSTGTVARATKRKSGDFQDYSQMDGFSDPNDF